MSAPLVIVGGGGHAKVVASLVHRGGHWRAIGYTDIHDRGSLLGLAYLGSDEMLRSLRASGAAEAAVIGIGQLDGDASTRIRLFEHLGELGFQLPVIVDPSATIGQETQLGDATVVMAAAVVNVGARVGAACIINTHATVEHDCKVGAHTHIAPGATVCGGCEIGASSMVGAGAVLAHGVRVAGGCLIGAGATVVSDITEPGVYVGTPARKLR